MENFVHHQPIKILFGRGMLAQLGAEVSGLGSHLLFVYGRQSIRRSGLYLQLKEQLENSGIRYTEYGNVPPNPRLSDCKRGIEIARQAAIDAVLAVGGGSVIDTAKGIAAGVGVQHDLWKFFTGRKTVRSALPLLTVPTVAGSGSEINHAMVLTHDKLGHKFGFAHRLLYPHTCIADPDLTATVPAQQTACGAVDTLCHCLEPYMTARANGIELQRGVLEHICATVVNTVPISMEQPKSYSLRAALLWSAMMAMSPTATAGLGRVYHTLHLLEHGLSARYDIAHGIGLAALLPGWLRYHQDEWEESIGRWGSRVFPITSAVSERTEATINELQNFLNSIGCPTSLAQLGIGNQQLDSLAEHAEAANRVRPIAGFDRNTACDMLACC
ncbi:MAG: iron-containing alcohol dehydrogenase [Desulfofustis sp.]